MPALEKKLTTSEAKSEFSRSPQLYNLRKKAARVCIFFFAAAVVKVVVDVEVGVSIASATYAFVGIRPAILNHVAGRPLQLVVAPNFVGS